MFVTYGSQHRVHHLHCAQPESDQRVKNGACVYTQTLREQGVGIETVMNLEGRIVGDVIKCTLLGYRALEISI